MFFWRFLGGKIVTGGFAIAVFDYPRVSADGWGNVGIWGYVISFVRKKTQEFMGENWETGEIMLNSTMFLSYWFSDKTTSGARRIHFISGQVTPVKQQETSRESNFAIPAIETPVLLRGAMKLKHQQCPLPGLWPLENFSPFLLESAAWKFWPAQNDWLIQYLIFAEGIFSLSAPCWEEQQLVIAMDTTYLWPGQSR